MAWGFLLSVLAVRSSRQVKFVKTAGFKLPISTTEPIQRFLFARHQSRCRAAKPFGVEQIVGAVLFQFEQGFVDPFAYWAFVRESDAIAFFAKNRPHGLESVS